MIMGHLQFIMIGGVGFSPTYEPFATVRTIQYQTRSMELNMPTAECLFKEKWTQLKMNIS